MFSVLVSIDIGREALPDPATEFFVSLGAVGEALHPALQTDAMKLAALKELLAEEAENQGARFDPKGPVGYVYLTHRDG